MTSPGARAPLLSAHDLSMRFGGLAAVDELCLAVGAGTVSGLIGPNGAGKTTVLNILSGLQRPTAGRIEVDGTDVTRWSADRRARDAGVLRTFQTVRLFPTMTVFETVLTAAAATRRGTAAYAATREAIARLGLEDVSEALATVLPYGRQRRVEVARAIAASPRLLLLDEPAAGLSPREREELATVMRELADEGMAVLLVEHHMDLVHAVCSEVTVIDFGRRIFHGTVDDAIAAPQVVASYLGSAENTPEAM